MNVDEYTDLQELKAIHELTEKNSHVTVKYFFDCSSIVYMLDSNQKLSDLERHFKYHMNDRLVESLAYSGYIRNYGLLPPHFVELKYRIERFLKFNHRPTKAETTKIYNDYCKLTGEDVEDLISNAKERFVIYQMINRVDAIARLKYLIENEYMSNEVSPNFIDYKGILEKQKFKRLLDALNKERPDKDNKTNNLYDAYALFLLLEKVREFNLAVLEGKPIDLPFFYDNVELMNKVVKRSELSEDFMLNLPNQVRIFSLKTSRFFIKNAILFPVKSSTKTEMSSGRISHEKLLELEDAFIKKRNALLSIVGEKRTSFFKEVKDRLRQLEEVEFYNAIWYPSFKNLGSDGLKDYYQNYREDEEHVLSEKTSVIKYFEQRTDELSKMLQDVGAFYQNISSGLRANRDNVITRPDSYANANRDYGLTIFSLPEAVILEIDELVIMIKNDEQFENALTALLNKYHSFIAIYNSGTNYGVNPKTSTHDANNLLVILSISWLYDMWTVIVHLTEFVAIPKQEQNCRKKYGDNFYFTINVFRISALIRIARLNEARKDILDLTKLFAKSKAVNIFMGLSFINFHLWRKINRYRFSDRYILPDDFHFRPETKKYFDNSIQNLSKAIESVSSKPLNEFDEETLEYLYNNYIYYITEGGPVAKFNLLTPYVDEFKCFITDFPVLKQDRYNDTLARYYLRFMFEAGINKSESEFIKYRNRTKEIIDTNVREGRMNLKEKKTLQDDFVEKLESLSFNEFRQFYEKNMSDYEKMPRAR